MKMKTRDPTLPSSAKHFSRMLFVRHTETKTWQSQSLERKMMTTDLPLLPEAGNLDPHCQSQLA
jgi:hypothetical protein